MKIAVVSGLEWLCEHMHWMTHHNPWLFLTQKLPSNHCYFAYLSSELDKKWETGQWKEGVHGSDTASTEADGS
jgi:hypothetical protein